MYGKIGGGVVLKGQKGKSAYFLDGMRRGISEIGILADLEISYFDRYLIDILKQSERKLEIIPFRTPHINDTIQNILTI